MSGSSVPRRRGAPGGLGGVRGPEAEDEPAVETLKFCAGDEPALSCDTEELLEELLEDCTADELALGCDTEELLEDCEEDKLALGCETEKLPEEILEGCE